MNDWFRNLTWKQRYAEKAAWCDDIEKQLSRFNRRRSELEKNERLAKIAERIHQQSKAKKTETGGPMVKCVKCTEVVFAAEGDLCGLCELEMFFSTKEKKID
jgi:hypothetical protein